MLKNLREKFVHRTASLVITPWLIWLGSMGIILLAGLVAGILVFWKGLVITNLTDRVPWGLWITIDLSSIALGAGAFSLCAGVYLFGLKRYQPIARTATFVGLIGYTMATPEIGVEPEAASVHAVGTAIPPLLFVTVFTRVRCVSFVFVIVQVEVAPAVTTTF